MPTTTEHRLRQAHDGCPPEAIEHLGRLEGAVAWCRRCGTTWHRRVDRWDEEGRPDAYRSWLAGTPALTTADEPGPMLVGLP